MHNTFELLFDTLEEAGVYANDSQVHRIQAEVAGVCDKGRIELTIRTMENLLF